MVENAKKHLMKIYVKEGTSKDGKKFTYFKTLDKNGKLVDVRFRQDVTNKPVKTCNIVVLADDVNLDTKREYPCYWVKAIQEIREIEYTKNDLPFEEIQ